MGGIVSSVTNAISGVFGGVSKAVSGLIGGVFGGLGSALAPKPPPMPSFMDVAAPPAAAASLLPPPLVAPADPSNGTAQAERDAAADAERKRLASARGFASTNPTGGQGDLSTPNLAAKSLLGQ